MVVDPERDPFGDDLVIWRKNGPGHPVSRQQNRRFPETLLALMGMKSNTSKRIPFGDNKHQIGMRFP